MPTTVTVAGQAATDVTVVSDTELTFTTPAGTAGTADVTVTTSGGSATLADGFEYLDVPNLALDIPDTIPVTVGEPAVYPTRLTNFGAATTNVTEEIRLSNAAGDLTVDDVVYESKDVGGEEYSTATFLEEDGDLVSTYTFANTHANLDKTNDVRITVNRDTGDITGTSSYSNDDGPLTSTTYTFVVTDGGA